jgi:hypothetical protein
MPQAFLSSALSSPSLQVTLEPDTESGREIIRIFLKGDKGTQRHTAQDFETIEGTKNREPQSSSPNEYVP